MNNQKTENIGRIIAEKRKLAGMTQEALASKLNITPQAISKWENGVGLPDLTLVPQIASALGISLSELFGAEESRQAPVPREYMGLSLISTNGKRAVYSSKSVLSVRAGDVTFTDGSSADILTNTVINCGSGEIRIFDLYDIIPDTSIGGYERDTMTKLFGVTHSLEISNSTMCNIEIIRGNDGETKITAEGSKLFLERLDIAESNGLLVVNAQQYTNNSSETENRITIAVGYESGKFFGAKISGCGAVKSVQSFDRAELTVNGSGGINARNIGDCKVTIAGSGQIATEDVSESLDVTISGSGAVACANVHNLTARISGSGDLAAMRLDGFLNAKISGCGNIACTGGEVESFNAAISGMGDLACERLTVRDADISIRGSGNISIGRIIGKSVEKLSRASTLTVGKRG